MSRSSQDPALQPNKSAAPGAALAAALPLPYFDGARSKPVVAEASGMWEQGLIRLRRRFCRPFSSTLEFRRSLSEVGEVSTRLRQGLGEVPARSGRSQRSFGKVSATSRQGLGEVSAWFRKSRQRSFARVFGQQRFGRNYSEAPLLPNGIVDEAQPPLC